MNNKWIPEIMYEDDAEGMTGHLPFIPVPNGETMPRFLLIWESRDTGELEPNSEGEPVPIYEMDLHQYASMNTLKEKLTAAEYDKVRAALGLEPLKIASKKGSEITENVKKNLNQ